ncbi:hypothetical protein CHUAL_011976 [Chamberlinius hualienensis]
MSSLSHFAEKSGIEPCITPWGRWWQTVNEVSIEVNVPVGTRGPEVRVNVKPKYISVKHKDQLIFEGELCYPVVADETIWTIEEKKLVHIQLTKADPMSETKTWTSLLAGGQYAPDLITLRDMETKIDLEKFQIENPGFDFSGAKLSKSH